MLDVGSAVGFQVPLQLLLSSYLHIVVTSQESALPLAQCILGKAPAPRDPGEDKQYRKWKDGDVMWSCMHADLLRLTSVNQ